MSSNPRETWDFGRFVQTLVDFEALPFMGCLKRILQGQTRQPTYSSGGQNMGVIVVAGATGGVGKRVVERLLAQNYAVRALVRDANRARTILGDRVELFEADLTIPETLTPALMRDAIAIICCTGTRVQPVEGDTPTREKYYQGIKFYLPEVADSPEAVEYQGIQNLVNLAVRCLPDADQQTIFDFKSPNSQIAELWGAVDDVVMGGVSESEIRLIEGSALFSGVVSTANSGGFASVRTKNLTPPLDLSQFSGIELRLKGDGQRYKCILRGENKWDGIGYSYSFDTIANQWITVRIPFSDLVPVFRAKVVRDAQRLDTQRIYAFQLMLSKFEYDGALNPHFNPGGFALYLESIKAYGGNTTPRFIHISSAGVTRPGKPGLNLAEEPPAVRMNDQLGGLLTWKLRGEEVIRQSRLPYTIIRPCALTEETGGQTLRFEQGDTIRGQVSREDIAQLCVEALKLPEACQTTFEVKAQPGLAENNWKALFQELDRD
ncbi:MAG: NAD(P)H-binding protein [Desertifilum sp. SIO1I2]|nr:NAD(P)H-binding protein [Desertifilum sp. SIO1I2]